MNDMGKNIDFDIQTAWLRRFKDDAESNLQALALRLKEAMPDHVTVLETKPFLFGSAKITGVCIVIGERKYTLEIVKGQLRANVAMVVREITLNTKSLEPAEWFRQLADETQKATDHAKNLSQSLSSFMSS